MQGKRSGDGDQKDVEEEICVTVNNFFSVSVNFFCVCFFFLNSASWGAIPSACFVRCTCALKYNNIIYIVVTASYMVLVAIKLPFLARATGTGTGVAWVQL